MRGILLVAKSARLDAQGTTSTSQHRGVSRVVLNQGLPSATPGWELSVRRVTFKSGARIPGEIHPGMQVVYIVSGTLNLKVLGGEAKVTRAKADSTQGAVESFKPSPNEIVLKAGDTVLEPETLVLAPRNASNEPLVILASSLLSVGQPPDQEPTQAQAPICLLNTWIGIDDTACDRYSNRSHSTEE